MIEELLKDIRENWTEKLSKPFGGTFVIAWLIHNWLLVYTLFNFDSGTTLHSKTDFIQSYINKPDNWCRLLWYPIVWAFVAIFLYLFLTNASLAISLAFSKWVRPFIISVIDRNDIVARKDYDAKNRALIKITKEKDALSEGLSTTIQENERLENENTDLNKKLANQQEATINLTDALNQEREKYARQVKNENDRQRIENENRQKLAQQPKDDFDKLFTGKWENRGRLLDGQETIQPFEIRDGAYFISGHPGNMRFKVIQGTYDYQKGYVKFTKIRSNNDYLDVELLRINDKKFIGIEYINGVSEGESVKLIQAECTYVKLT
jgi:hypothetical protein